MGKIFMIIWALVMLFANFKSYKSVYFTDRNETNKKAIAKLEESNKDGSIGLLIISVGTVFIIDFLFWLIMTVAFTNPLVILFGCIVLLYGLYTFYLLLKFINDKQAPKQIIPYFLLPLKTVMIIAYICILLF